MKYIKYFLVLCISILSMFSTIRDAYAQQSSAAFLYAGPEEANALTEAYMEPLILGLSYGMSNGWYSTAKTHMPLGFDISVNASACFMPASSLYFRIDTDTYSHITTTVANGLIPTVIGPKDGNEVFLSFTDEHTGTYVESVQTVSGAGLQETFGYNIIPTPVLQLGIGTFWNTDIIVRFMPTLQRGDISTSLFGLGIKHDIGQWVPTLEALPWNIALFAAFSGFDNSMDMRNVQIPGQHQETLFDINGWTVQGLFSREFAVITLYGAIGYGTVSSAVRMMGTYRLTEEALPGSGAVTLHNPVQLCYKERTPRATAGFRMKLGVFFMHADYTYQQFHNLSAGIGFSFR